jgi:hypothetical protein
MRFTRWAVLALFLVLALGSASLWSGAPSTGTPPVWTIVSDSFESGTLDSWRTVSPENLALLPGEGQGGSTGLSVRVDTGESYLYQSGVARAEEGYLTFWLNPIGLHIPDEGTTWVPGKSIRVATVKGAQWWHEMVALRVWRPQGQGYRGYLEWRAADGSHFDLDTGQFDIVDGWQKITLGFHTDEWVAVWVNDAQVRVVTGIDHEEAFGEIIEFGKTNANANIAPSGEMRYDNIAFHIPRIDDLWVDAENGDDDHDGQTEVTAFHTIQKAADLAGPGTTVHILPGVHRETVWPAMDGSAAEPVLYVAEHGPGTVFVRGSEPASSLSWIRLEGNTIGLPPGVDPTGIYYADLSDWGLPEPPRFVVELDGDGEVVARLPLAREPDWEVSTDWKYHEFWWAADGGWDVAGCNPATDSDLDCDYSWRSLTQLTDRTHDVDPPGVEAGNLTTIGDLTGGTLVALDSVQGHYAYRRSVIGHDVEVGRITVSEICEHDNGSGNPGLGWGTKYYVEGTPYLLDTPGEWWYDAGTARLYLWPATAGSPAMTNVEISRQDFGFVLSRRSWITLDGLALELWNGTAIYGANSDSDQSSGNQIRNTTIRYANYGVYLEQRAGSNAPDITNGFVLEDSEIGYVDTYGLYLGYWWDGAPDPAAFTHAGIANTVIRNSELHHLGFRSDRDNAVGALLPFAHRLRFEGNHVHHVAQNGLQLSRSVVQSNKTYGFDRHEIKTGEILIKDNVFEKACQLNTDCGALKIWGDSPDNHVFRDALITGNVFRDTFGWTYVSEQRGHWAGGPESDVRGMGGFGLYMDMASGIHVYRNVAYRNAYAGFMFAGVWRDGDIVCYNNTVADSLLGFYLAGSHFDTHNGSLRTRLLNNIVVNNEGYGILQSGRDATYGDLAIDHNLYFGNGWRSELDGGLWMPGAMAVYLEDAANQYCQTLGEIQVSTSWESHGASGDPALWNYDVADHDLFGRPEPDFHLTAASDRTIDKGTTELPDSLQALLETFGVMDWQQGNALDIGRYEAGFLLSPSPTSRALLPGGTTYSALRIHPVDLPYAVTLTAASPSPRLVVSLDPTVLTPPAQAMMVIRDTGKGPSPLPGTWHTVPITGSGGGFVASSSVRLLLGGAQVFLPVAIR